MFSIILRATPVLRICRIHAPTIAKASFSVSLRARNSTITNLEKESITFSQRSEAQKESLSQNYSENGSLETNYNTNKIENSLPKLSAQMPLRSKINDQYSSDKVASNSPSDSSDRLPPKQQIYGQVIKELPEDEKEDVLFNTLFGIRTIELNRPAKFNSLNGSMIRKIIPRLQEWAKSDMANVVIIKGVGPKAFCSGGDVVELVEQNLKGEKGQQKSVDFFSLEYKLDHLISTYSRPYIAFMDGITMGGGVGLSMHAPIRIATERTIFAMPETKIGLFPDVGASFFLPRLDGSIGTYLGLTGKSLTGINVFYTGIATHYIHSSSLNALEHRLAELRFKDYDTLGQRLDLINSTVEEFVTGLPLDQPMEIASKRRKAIDRCFGQGSVVKIIAALKAEKEGDPDWASKTIEELQRNSPTSLFVTLRLLQLGKKWTIAEAFKREHVLMTRFMRSSDFIEGVDALLIRKDKLPKWVPDSIGDEEIENKIADNYLDAEGFQPIKLLNETDYPKYPFNNYCLPSEESVRTLVKSKDLRKEEVVNEFIKTFKGKQGVAEVVTDIIQRKTMLKSLNRTLAWIDDGQDFY